MPRTCVQDSELIEFVFFLHMKILIFCGFSNYTNKSEQILDHGVIPCGISDHDVTFAIRSMKVPKRKSLHRPFPLENLMFLMK